MAFQEAIGLISTLDREFTSIVVTSLRVSLSASVVGFLLALPLAAFLVMRRFVGRSLVLVVINALQGLPPVLVGLVLYLILSRSGPLGALGLLFTTTGMIIAQTVLVLPIFASLMHRQFEQGWREIGDLLRMDGVSFLASVRMLLVMGRAGLVTVFLTGFGRAIAEVGAIMIVGGNIRGQTRTMTTAIALETSKGDLALALALGLVLVSLTLMVSLLAFGVGRVQGAGR